MQTIKKEHTININEIINEDHKNEIIDLLNERRCKKNIKKYSIISKNVLLYASTILIFLATSIGNENQKKILTICAGCVNTIIISTDKLISVCDEKIKQLDIDINIKINDVENKK